MKAGLLQVDRIEEVALSFPAVTGLLPDFDPVRAAAALAALGPGHIDAETTAIRNSIHSWVLRLPDLTILVDTCGGNHKDRPRFPPSHQLETPFLERLAALGVRPEEVDLVLCTHLHVDHVGWNTRLDNGSWVPTFPRARYLFGRTEFDHWKADHDRGPQHPVNQGSFADSVLPVVDAGLVDFIDPGHVVAPGLTVEGAPGHSPGHCVLRARGESRELVFTGDLMHHPIQMFFPDWNSRFCINPDQARASRRRVLGEAADQGAVILPAHFAAPHVARVRRTAEAFEPVFDVAS